MLNCQQFYQELLKNHIDRFIGVPDSSLKDICAFIADNSPKNQHTITANEGNAIALATGYHLATKKTALVYMQNSGQGNAVNPLTSLVSPDVYKIPVLIMIGWRGEPGGKHDEPQHLHQGKITLTLMDTLSIPYRILPDNIQDASTCLKEAVQSITHRNAPFALIIRPGTFEEYQLQTKQQTNFELFREDALKLVLESTTPNDIIVSTTGQLSRELFELREQTDKNHEKDFLTVGSMGHSSSIALGIATEKTQKNVYCLDGDGALIMHMGSLAIIGSEAPKNLKHVIFNNGAHDSVGGQSTVAFNLNIPAIAKACGYKNAWRAETSLEIKDRLQQLNLSEGPSLIEIRINKGARKDLGRPTTTPQQNKEAFMKFLEE